VENNWFEETFFCLRDTTLYEQTAEISAYAYIWQVGTIREKLDGFRPMADA
jgi:hypothetical protein